MWRWMMVLGVLVVNSVASFGAPPFSLSENGVVTITGSGPGFEVLDGAYSLAWNESSKDWEAGPDGDGAIAVLADVGSSYGDEWGVDFVPQLYVFVPGDASDFYGVSMSEGSISFNTGDSESGGTPVGSGGFGAPDPGVPEPGSAGFFLIGLASRGLRRQPR